MTIAAQTAADNRTSAAGNGVTTSFSFPKPFTAQADLVVQLVLVASPYTATTQTLTTHYTISGTADAQGRYGSGANVVFLSAPSALYNVVIYADPSVAQGLDLVENDPLPAEQLELSYDKLTLLERRTRDLLARTLRYADSEVSTASLVIPTPAANNIFGWNAAGTALVNYVIQAGTSLVSLAASGGAALIGFIQSGAGAAATDVQTELRKTFRASQFAGATADVKINAAITALLAASPTGGIVDATDLTGAQTIAATISVGTAGKPVWLKLGRTSFSVTSAVGAGAAIDVVSVDSRVSGQSTGAPSSVSAATTITSAAGHTGQIIKHDPGATTESRVLVEDLFLDCNSISAYGVYLDHFAGVRLYRVSAARATTDNFRFGVNTGSFTAEVVDCYSKNGTSVGFHVKAPHVKLTRCASDGSANSVLIDGADGGFARFSQCHFEGATTAAIKIDGGTGKSIINGNYLNPYSTGAGIIVTNTATARSNIISSNDISCSDNTAIGIDIQGANGSINRITGNNIRGCGYGVKIVGDLNALVGNFLDVVTEGVTINGTGNSIVGGSISVSSGTNAVNVTGGTDNSADGVYTTAAFAGNVFGTSVPTRSWTPAVTFGGGSTGITYTTQSGGYIRAGKKVTAWFAVTLSSKGSSTGQMQITGLPFAVANTTEQNGAAGSFSYYANFTGLVVQPILTPQLNATAFYVQKASNNTVGGLADTDCTNTTQIQGTLDYHTT